MCTSHRRQRRDFLHLAIELVALGICIFPQSNSSPIGRIYSNRCRVEHRRSWQELYVAHQLPLWSHRADSLNHRRLRRRCCCRYCVHAMVNRWFAVLEKRKAAYAEFSQLECQWICVRFGWTSAIPVVHWHSSPMRRGHHKQKQLRCAIHQQRYQ